MNEKKIGQNGKKFVFRNRKIKYLVSRNFVNAQSFTYLPLSFVLSSVKSTGGDMSENRRFLLDCPDCGELPEEPPLNFVNISIIDDSFVF